MTELDEPRTLDTDALLATIYAIQTDLKLLVEQLARDRNPNPNDHTIIDLAYLQAGLEAHTPSLTRH